MFKWHGVHRMPNGSILLSADAGAVCAMIFWVIIIILGLAIYFVW